ncbi:tetratricopeptide repeat protein [Novosphingobium sp. 9]|uniref:tetratricopeptide repeat protein n=1 Tax=Novosphingobium sp. 9 TaxID=2025349 RepID=UPI0021B5A21C|nr:tetratricopeptide repeat protein [Novosphingobium sp. 9]
MPLLVMAGMVASLIVHPAAVVARQDGPGVLIGEARDALRSGDGIAAEMKLRAALAGGASRAAVAAYMGEAYIVQSDPDNARKWLETRDFDSPSAPEGWRNLALVELQIGNIGAAGEAYRKALTLAPNDAGLWVEVGRWNYAAGRHLDAIAAARRAIELAPNNVQALRFTAQLVRDSQGLVASLPWFEHALRVDPNDAGVLTDYAATLCDMGRGTAALAATRRLLTVSPGNANAYYIQSLIAARAGRYTLARGVLERAGTTLDTMPGVMLLHGVLEADAGNYATSSDWLEKLLQQRPDDRAGQNLLARVLYLSGQYSYVIQRFSDVASRPDATPYLLTVLARAEEALGDRQAAGVLLDRAARGPQPGLHVLAGTSSVADLLAQSRTQTALNATEAALKHSPGSYDALSLAGDAALAAHDPQQAMSLYRQAAGIRFPDGLFLRWLAALDAANDRAGAVALVQARLARDPASRVALMAAGQQAQAEGRPLRAAALLRWLRDNGGSDDVAVLSRLAAVEVGSGNLSAGLSDARRAYDLQRASPLATRALAYALAATHRGSTEALALAEKASALGAVN